MFALGVELRDVLKKQVLRRSSPLAVGLATCVPKLIAYRVISPAFDLGVRARLVCTEASTENLLADLLAGRIDLAVTDCPVASTSSVRVQSHLVGQCNVAAFCARDMAEHYRLRFPGSLDGAPFVLPSKSSPLHDALLDWFRRERVAPVVVAEIESPDLINTLGEMHGALFALPAMIANEVERTNRVAAVGEIPIEQQFYAISTDRTIGHELASAIVHDAHARFSREPQATHGSNRLHVVSGNHA
jgi:LysR family transcriptional activator of nhaA